MIELERKKRHRQRIYEQLGAPCLLYRHAPSYTSSFDSIPNASSWKIRRQTRAWAAHETLQSWNRIKTRWNFPIDQHYVPNVLVSMIQKKKRGRPAKKQDTTLQDPSLEIELSEEMKKTQKKKRGRPAEKQVTTLQNPPGEVKKIQKKKRGRASKKKVTLQDPTLEIELSEEEKKKKGGPQKPTFEIELSDEVKKKLSKGVKREKRRCRTLPLLQAGRLTMLLAERQVDASKPMELLENYAALDYPYLEASHNEKQRKKGGVTPGALKKIQKELDNSRVFHQQRHFAADPCYLGPFSLSSLESSMGKQDGFHLDSNTGACTSPASTITYGNCLVCLPCPCPPCRRTTTTTTTTTTSQKQRRRHGWCLLHPTGDLLDRVCMSNLILPNGQQTNTGYDGRVSLEKKKGGSNCCIAKDKTLKPLQNEVDVVDTVLQLISCGSWRDSTRHMVFAARTASHVSVLSMTVEKLATSETSENIDDDDDICWGNYPMKEMHRIDLRSLSRFQPSYRPVDLSAHPNYGNAWSNPRLAIVSHCHRTETANMIHHVTVKDNAPFVMTEHRISNLNTISLIDYSSSHPMCLWSVARSYVSPAVAAPPTSLPHPHFDFGTSLYNIDLRSNQATFQWSPSGQDFVTEGVHSISGIMTDWQKEHRVWVRSMSAAKTWELDTRMPCKVVTEWSLPSSCDDNGTHVPVNGLHGDGSLMIQPPREYYTCTTSSDTSSGDQQQRLSPDPPILTVEKTPETFGFHLYQRPENGPRFGTKNLECISAPGLLFTDKTSIAAGTVVPLPDVAKTIFTCGLSTLRTTVSELFVNDQVEKINGVELDTSVLGVVTMTNKGDIYLHSLLECSGEEETSSRAYTDLPLGSRAIAVPERSTTSPSAVPADATSSRKKCNGGLNLCLLPNNQYPIPGASVMTSSASKKSTGHTKPTSTSIPLDLFPNKAHPTVLEEDSYDSDASPGYNIRPQRNISVTLVTNNNSNRNEPATAPPRYDPPVALPATVVHKSQRGLAFMPERFIKDPALPPEPGQENWWGQEVEERPARSDLTRSMLRTSEGLWGRFDAETVEEDLRRRDNTDYSYLAEV